MQTETTTANPGLSPELRTCLQDIALGSIRSGLEGRGPRLPSDDTYRGLLGEKRAAFVTLIREGRLRGCIGTTEATWPLARAVAQSAYDAAFRDPRFPPLQAEELEWLSLKGSVLSPCQRLEFESEQALLRQLRPGIDGLTIALDTRRATFLPAVWEQLESPAEFLLRLKEKAGLSAAQAPEAAWRYTTDSF